VHFYGTSRDFVNFTREPPLWVKTIIKNTMTGKNQDEKTHHGKFPSWIS
jgi:hypothetical protein